MWGNNNKTNNMEKSREHLRHFRCARRADDAAGVCGERRRLRRRPPCGGLTISPRAPHLPHHHIHCSRAIHLVIAHPTCRGGASASVAHWGIARLSQQLLLLFCCFSFKQNSPPCYAAKAQIFCDCIYREIKSKQVERSRRFCS